MKKPLRLIAAGLVGVAAAFMVPSISTDTRALAQEAHQQAAEKHKLGKKKVGEVEVSVITIGEVEPGGHVDFDIKLYTKDEPKALRAWVGIESAQGSTKAPGEKQKEVPNGLIYTGHITVPQPIPAGSKLWVEIETAAGTNKAAWSYDEHDHKH